MVLRLLWNILPIEYSLFPVANQEYKSARDRFENDLFEARSQLCKVYATSCSLAGVIVQIYRSSTNFIVLRFEVCSAN